MRYLRVDPSSGIWHFRYKVPRHLRLFFGVTEITKSLRTSNKKQATLKALKLEIEIKEKTMIFEDCPVNSFMQALLDIDEYVGFSLV